MIIIPAIDLRGGNVVRLLRGDYAQETMYAHDPQEIANKFFADGAQMLHIVDLDGARDGHSVNLGQVKKIFDATRKPIEFGGGLRSVSDVESALSSGAARAIIGTKALEADLLRRLIATYGAETIVVGIDAADGIVKTEGWLRDSGISVEHACEQILACGVSHIIYTDISRDGTLAGPNIASLKKVLQFTELQVVASGGIGTLDDLKRIAALQASNIFGIIIGKALYEGTVDLKEAINLIKQ
jgi:phosphoribosylformimino-5-aminoimidazole carboxamide ribotide isomerase